ncbi:MAG: S66 peptidase family protein [Candidatus Binatia bacterium]
MRLEKKGAPLAVTEPAPANPRRPPALRAGDCVAVVAPAAAIDRASLDRGVRVLASFGYRVRVAPEAYRRSGYLAGADEPRAESFRTALVDPEVRAVFLARGGYGSARLLPLLEDAFGACEPKILVGYSDATALLGYATTVHGWVTFHGPMVATDVPDMSRADARSLRDLLEGKTPPPYRLSSALRGGVAEGRLVGGNLSTIVSLLGTPYAIRCRRAILFLEDRNERPYRIDRMLTQLRLGGILDSLEGLVFGEMPECGEAKELRRIVREVTGQFDFPIAFGLRSGHGRGKRTLPLGVSARLDAGKSSLEILEPVVR